jgi:hypothetical protein
MERLNTGSPARSWKSLSPTETVKPQTTTHTTSCQTINRQAVVVWSRVKAEQQEKSE